MILTMLVTLYTSRVVLNTLGIEDFGIYNVVGGVVVLFGFINSAMSSATQRFLNFSMAQNDKVKLRKTFSASLTSHIFIALIVFLIAETIGLWFLNTYINIPENRVIAANWVYQFSILTMCVSFIKVPYNALIIANERMSFYAYISIIEVALKLLVVYLLCFSYFDRLSIYSFLLFVVSLIVLLFYRWFCLWKLQGAKYYLFYEKKTYVEMFSFSGWSLLGGLSSTGVQQGSGILLNVFFGVIINTAVGIANQVSYAVYTFASNFQLAFTPQLTKYYANKQFVEMYKLINSSCKYSFYLFLFISFPLFLPMDYILKVWLKILPEWSVEFTRFTLLILAIETLSAPLWISMQATGRIKNYQIGVSLIMITILPVSYLLFYKGFSPLAIFVVRLIITLCLLVYRLIFLYKEIQLPLTEYTQKVLVPILIISVMCFVWLFCTVLIAPEWTLSSVLLYFILTELFLFLAIYFAGLSSFERNNIKLMIRKLWKKA